MSNKLKKVELTISECKQISEILRRRANEISGFNSDYQRNDKHYGSVELALTREVDRLRRLSDRVDPPEPEDEDE